MGGVKHFRHLVVVDTAGVVTEGSVSVFVFKGFDFALVASAVPLGRMQGSKKCRGVIVEVPGRRGELVPRGQVIEQVEGAHSVGGSQGESWSLLARNSPLFMPSRGWRLWYSFIRCGTCRLVMGSQVLLLLG